MLDKLMALCPNSTQTTLQLLLDEAEADFKAICGRDDVPTAAQGIVIRMARVRFNSLGADGLSSQTYSGAGEGYLADYPEDLKRAMYRFRKLVAV